MGEGQGGGETLLRSPATSPRFRLRALLAQPGPLTVPFAYDALSARLIEAAGFDAAGISGSAVAASLLALPDVGLVSREETVAQARRIVEAVSIPVIADADTGYGGPLQAARTLRDLEAAGVAGLFMEDQQDPKRCAHLAGARVISRAAMLGKIKAALKARQDPDLVFIARTDALAPEGMEGAVGRAKAYLDAGADMVFVAAPRSREQLEALPRLVDGPLMVVLSEGGVTPLLSVRELAEIGYKLIGYSGTALGAAARAVERALHTLHQEGTTASLLDAIMPLPERNRLLGLAAYQALEEETVRDD